MADISGFKFNGKGVSELLSSQPIKDELMSHGERIAESLNSEGHGEFLAHEGSRGKRAHVFVNPHDFEAARAVNADPAMFQRNI